MRRWQPILTLGFLLGALLFLLPAGLEQAAGQTQTEDGRSLRTISVSGTGQAAARPDVAVIRVGVETEAEEASAALTQNSERMQAVVEALQEAGLPPEDIQTQTVQLQPRHQEGPPQPGIEPARGSPGPPELVSYRAVNIVEARIRDLGELGQLLDSAVQAGGNRVEGIRFEVSDPAQLLEEARAAAWEDARGKADQLVELAGAELGEVWSIREFSSTPRPVSSGMMQEAAMAVPIEPGSQTIEVRLEVTWLLP